MDKIARKQRQIPEFYDLSERLLNSGDACWGNLGYWKEGDDYSQACENLAHHLAGAINLDQDSRVFDAGFGCGDQLLLWRKDYHVQFLCGINYSISQTALAKIRVRQQDQPGSSDYLVQGDVADLKTCSAINHKAVNKIVALDCAYHFPSREKFLCDSFQILQQSNKNVQILNEREVPAARIGLTDIVLAQPTLTWRKRWVLNVMLKFSRIPNQNIVTLDEYKNQLHQAGFTHVISQDISAGVFIPFGDWVTSSKEAAHKLRGNRSAWVKYRVTAGFLKWAFKHKVLRYVVISAH